MLQSHEYSRTGNPTRDVLEQVLANLEGAKYGIRSINITLV